MSILTGLYYYPKIKILLFVLLIHILISFILGIVAEIPIILILFFSF